MRERWVEREREERGRGRERDSGAFFDGRCASVRERREGEGGGETVESSSMGGAPRSSFVAVCVRGGRGRERERQDTNPSKDVKAIMEVMP